MQEESQWEILKRGPWVSLEIWVHLSVWIQSYKHPFGHHVRSYEHGLMCLICNVQWLATNLRISGWSWRAFWPPFHMHESSNSPMISYSDFPTEVLSYALVYEDYISYYKIWKPEIFQWKFWRIKKTSASRQEKPATEDLHRNYLWKWEI